MEGFSFIDIEDYPLLIQFGTETETVSPESLKEEYKNRAAAVAEK